MTLKLNTPREGTIAQICFLQGWKEALEMLLRKEVDKLAEYDAQQKSAASDN